MKAEYVTELSEAAPVSDPDLAALEAAISSGAHEPGQNAESLSSRILPMSFEQRSVWFGQEYVGQSSPAYVMGGLFEIEGPLEADALKRAAETVVRRHRTLRSYLRRGCPLPYLEPQDEIEAPFEYHDVSRRPDPAAAAREIQRSAHNAPFVLHDSPLVRFTLVRETPSKHSFITSYHHLVTDASGGIEVFNEIAAVYNRELDPRLPGLPPAVDYCEFLESEREYASSQRFQDDREFWRKHFEGADLAPLFTPLEGRSAGFGESERLLRPLPQGLLERLVGASKQVGGTPTATFLAATALFLSRLHDRPRLTIGLPFLNRKNRRFRQIVGHFINTLPLALSVDSAGSFLDLASETGKLMRQAIRRAAYPIDELVNELGIRPKDTGTMFEASFNHVARTAATRLGAAKATLVPIITGHEPRIFGVSIFEFDEQGGAEVGIDYCLNYFTREGAETLMSRFVAFLERLAEAPNRPCGEYDVLLSHEAAQIVSWSAGPRAERQPNRRINEVFEETASAHPDQPAVIEGDQRTTYAELDRTANRVANALLAAGVRREEPVGVLARRSAALAATVLGIWKAGACYLPVDPEYPYERIRFMLENAGVGTVLALSEPPFPLAARVIRFADALEQPDARPEIPGRGSDLAYIIFTSGSTGKPKGVALQHAGFLNMIAGQIEFLSLERRDRVLLFAPPCFDASLSELFMALLSGAAVCPVGRDLIDAPWELRDYMTGKGISVATFPPSYLRLFDRAGFPGLRALITAGEAPNPGDARFYAERLCYVNAYGPTENSVCSTMGRVFPESAGPLTIGRPIPNVKAHILDRNLRPVPPGVAGELCLSGPGLARGYINRPDLTAASFVQAPFEPDERLYRSGDLARWTPDGEIEFLGRRDDQIKVRGYRVEPGEIESALARHPSVLQAAVVAKKANGSCSLHAFVVPAPGARGLEAEDVRRWASGQLPAFLCPSGITVLDSLPVNGSGKVDRRKLAGMVLPDGSASGAAPARTPTESALAAIWEECLEGGPVGARDDFFARGGNSLLAIRVTQRINEAFGVSLPARAIFQSSVLGSLAELVEAAATSAGEPGKSLPCGASPNGALAESQRQLWVVQQMVDRPEVYNMPALFDVETAGPLGFERWEKAFRAVVARHEALRTVFLEGDDGPIRKVLDSAPVRLERAHADSRRSALSLANDRLYEPFDTASAPLIRAGLTSYAPGRAIFHICVHHLAGDGESMRIIVEDLLRHLSGAAPAKPARAYSLAVAEELRYLASDAAAADRAWWLDRLRPPLTALDLAGVSRPPVKSYAGARLGTRFSAEVVEALGRIARMRQASLFSMMLALVKTLLHRRTGARDIIVGIPSTARLRPEQEGSVGYYVNTLAIRDAVHPDATFESFLSQVQASVGAAMAHGEYPFARLYADLGLERDPSRSPVFDVFLAPQPGAGEWAQGGITLRPVDFDVRAARFDLTFTYAEESDGSLRLFADFDASLFRPEDIRSMLEELGGLAAEAGKDGRMPVSRGASAGCGDVFHAGGAGPVTALLQQVWSSVLGAAATSADNFFALGGDSIKAIQVCGRLRKAGAKLAPRQIFEHPVLGDLARVLSAGSQSALPEPALPAAVAEEPGDAPLTPIQRWLFEDHGESTPSFLMNVVLTAPTSLAPSKIEEAVRAVAARHDAFRLRFEDGGKGMALIAGEAPEVHWREHRLGAGETFEQALKALAPMLHRRIDPGRGCHLAGLLLLSPDGNRLYLAAHHLVMDAVSWRIFLDELDAVCRGDRDSLPAPTAPFAAWARDCARYAESDAVREELPYWRAACASASASLPVRNGDTRAAWKECSRYSVELDAEITKALLTEAANRRGARPVELLLAGLGLALGRRIEGEAITVAMEGHGREPEISRLDVSRTMGWFTCRYPFQLALGRGDRESALTAVVEDFRAVPHNGVGFGALKRLAGENLPETAQVAFNYLGEVSDGGAGFELAPELPPSPVDAEYESDARLEIMAVVLRGRLRIEAVYHPAILEAAWVQALLDELGGILSGFGESPAQSQPLALTPSQEAMFFQYLSEPESGVYAQQMAFRLAGPVDAVRLLDAWRRVAARHDSLRAVFVQSPDGPAQVFRNDPPHVFALKDFSGLPEAARKREVETFLAAEKSAGLNIEEGPTFRAAVVRLGAGEHLLCWTFHHILMDGWCIGILLRETFEYLSHQDARLPAAPSPRAYIEWLNGRDREADLRFWRDYLEGFDTATGIPGVQDSSPGPVEPREMELRLDPHQTQRLARLAASLQCTPSVLLQAAWGVFLARHSNAKDVVFGVVTSGREAEVEGIEQMIGVLIRTTPVRLRLEDPGESFASVVRRLQSEVAARQPHETLPLPDIFAASPIGSGLFNHILLFENYPVDGIGNGGPEIIEVRGSEQLPYDLGLAVVPGRELLFRFSFNERVYPASLIEQVGRRLKVLLESILEDPQAAVQSLSVLPAEEQSRLIQSAQGPVRNWPEARPLPALFAERARVWRDRPAVVETEAEGGDAITYGELAGRTARLSQHLVERGAGPGQPVAVCLERSSRMVSALLAVMAAGSPYVPLDPRYPVERLRQILADSGAGLVLAERVTSEAIESARPESAQVVLLDDLPPGDESSWDGRLACRATAEDLAYIIYTSGSTGKPKGVELTHAALSNFLLSFAESPGMTPGDRVLALTTICFDIHIVELFLPLVVGAQLIMASAEEALDGRRLAALIELRGISFVQATPTSWKMLLDGGWQGRKDLKALAGGEPLPPALARRLLDLCGEVWNVYGPTEATVWATAKRMERDESGEPVITIGNPIPNTSLYVLSEELDLMPEGTVGELCIGGAGLARGYRNRPELNARQFVRLPFPPFERVYRTGDLGFRNAAGELVCLGRNDSQVKVRGFRIEPGEVEARLCAVPGVSSAVVQAGDYRGGGPELAAWIAGSDLPSDAVLRERLGRELPHYMVPSLFVRLAAMPTTPNGKIDRRSLKPPKATEAQPLPVRPLSETERLIAGLWRDILLIPEVNPADNFFALGGHSLMAMRLAAAIESATGRNTPVRAVFEHPTVESQALYVEGAEATPARPAEQASFEEIALSEEELEALRGLAGD